MSAVPENLETSVERQLVALIADDEAVSRRVLTAMLGDFGFAIIEAENGREACEICRCMRPDIVFMDAVMPELSGYEATTLIKKRFGEDYVPVIFLSAIADSGQLNRCIEAGGDDVLTKPVNGMLLKAKTEAALRTQAMHRRLALQRDELLRHQNRLYNDMQVAKRILENVESQNHLAVPNIHYLLRPMETLNGDSILAARRPTGEQCFLIGDFTGHGLPAAIGALTVQGIFSSMVVKGFALDDIVVELNHKLRALLPVDRFLSACILELDFATGLLRVWNGGMPEVLVRGADGGISARFPSTNVPLGIVADEAYQAQIVSTLLRRHDQVFACSDGVVEAHDLRGELFGRERVHDALEAAGAPAAVFKRLVADLAAHVGTAEQSDDIALLLVENLPDAGWRFDANAAGGRIAKPPGVWQFTLTLTAHELQTAEPVSAIVQVLDAAQGLGPYRTPLYMILTELFSNALEHGLLGLDSALKASASGFADYYALRQTRLRALADGTICITCQHAPAGAGGRLTISVAHDGIGFDPAALPVALDGNRGYQGRGIRLVESLCESLAYADLGRRAIATFNWCNAATSP